MPRKITVLAVVLATTLALTPLQAAVADTPQDAPAPDQQPAAEKPGLMTRFAKLFEPLDTSKPENQHVFVIGSGNHGAAPDSPASADKPVSAAPAAPPSSAVTAATADTAASTQADASTAGAKPVTHGFKLKSGFDSGDAPKPDEQAAPPPQ